jgi:hypothetical protein
MTLINRTALIALTCSLLLWPLLSVSFAAPGAHGPDGEHLDGKTAAAVASQRPRMEAKSELFELVATLHGSELSILVDRYETNEPVLNAELEIESGGLKAKAKFHADLGDYAVDDPALLKKLQTPGEHALVFTIVAGKDSDLLDGTLVTGAAGTGHDHDDHGHALEYAAWAGIALLGLAIAGFLIRRRRAPAVMMMAVLVLTLAHTSLATAAPGAHGPGGEHLDEPGGTVNANGLARLPDGSVNLPKAAQRRMSIRTVMATETEAVATIELPGRVVIDPNAGGRVQAVHGGRIEAGPRGLPVAGQPVKRGDVLAYIRHHAEPYAAGSQQALLAELRSQRQIAEQRVQRLESLEGTVPRKEIEAARAEAQSLLQRERSIGASLVAREALVAPVTGVIATTHAITGQVVESRDLLFEVVDPARMLVEATTADPALAARIAGAQLQGVPGTTLRLIGAARGLRDGLLPLTFSLRGEKSTDALPLAIGQPVTVIAMLKERSKGIVLPAQAVVRNASNEPVVWIKSGAERYLPQPVQFRPLDAQTVVVTHGLGADNRVVVQGAALIAQIR